jgi:pimeloyl-ACP methyl ester carboxylesterase
VIRAAVTALVLITILTPSSLSAADRQVKAEVLTECLVLGRIAGPGRAAIHQDPVEAAIVAGSWKAPHAGEEVKLPNGRSARWEEAKPDKNGSFNLPALQGGYAYFAVPSTTERAVLLEAAGHSMVYVDREPRAGDVYSYGYVRLPILLHPGTNDLLFHVGRGSVRAKLIEPKAPVCLNVDDTTLPDLIVGQTISAWGSVVIINASSLTAGRPELLHGRTLLVVERSGIKLAEIDVPMLPPLSTRKVQFHLRGPAPTAEGPYPVEVRLVSLNEGGAKNGVPIHSQTLDAATLTLYVRRPEQTHKRTFVSDIDGSVQYYSIVPPTQTGQSQAQGSQPLGSNEKESSRPGLILTLHGAGVEGAGQAACYSPKNWAYVVAPTNRRPYGFDWEDWGRLDFLEVLKHAQKELHTDPRRTYVIGHSMGGHGTWHLGVTYPDHFAAIGPSAGWVSMWSYAGARRKQNGSTLEQLVQRATSPSDTLALSRNYAMEGVYILHGDQDDNVPVEQARTMRRRLGTFHPDFAYHEQPGAGHWWGNPCVDWPPMMDFLKARQLPAPNDVRQVDFVTANPGVSATCHWATIDAQVHPLALSSLHLHCQPEKRLFHGTTDNVARLALDLQALKHGEPVQVELDGQKTLDIPWPTDEQRIWLSRDGSKWSVTGRPARTEKGAHRYGPFKEAFNHNVRFVYGTHGSDEENTWAFAKARFDAETFWYRGNGSIDVVSDKDFDPSTGVDHSVVVYGNANTNSAWHALVGSSPVQVRNGSIHIGDRELSGKALACLFVRPRPNSDTASVGVVSGTGPAGLRLTDRLPYLMSGVGYPDCIVLGTDVLTDGMKGLRVAGYFGNDWGVHNGDFAFRD